MEFVGLVMNNHQEEKIQEAIVKRFNELVFYKQIHPNCFLYSNRNENNVGGAKGIASGARFKRMGRLAGVPDLTLISTGYHNLKKAEIAYIEVKTPKEHRTSKGVETKSKGMNQAQIDFYNKFIDPMNIPFAVCSSVTDFENFIWFLKKC